MNDLISRKAVMGALKSSCIELGGSEWGDGEMGVHRDDIEAIVNSIPTVNVSDRNVGELISRQAAIDYIKTQRGRPFIGITLEDAIIMMIEEVPSVQPEVIRCKDCRFYKFKQGSLPWNNSRRYCNRSVSLSTQENDYCSYAELRGDSDE